MTMTKLIGFRCLDVYQHHHRANMLIDLDIVQRQVGVDIEVRGICREFPAPQETEKSCQTRAQNNTSEKSFKLIIL
jgi:hypothetical protein